MRYGCDSIMLLSSSTNAHVHAEVFEPNAGSQQAPGAISSMCGNGIRAVGAFLKSKNGKDNSVHSILISTRSGIRQVLPLQSNQYACHMGTFTESAKALSKYRKSNWKKMYDSTLKKIEQTMGCELVYDGMGLSGTTNESGVIDGEPHVVLVFDSTIHLDKEKIRHLLSVIGPMISKNTTLFPFEVNTNIVFLEHLSSEYVELFAMTFERNLGNDPHRSITQSCGTGATAVAGVLHNRLNVKYSCTYHVNTLGGRLSVIVDNDKSLKLQGPAIRIS